MNAAAVISILPKIEVKRILFATDFSDASLKALPVLANIARKYGSHVFLSHIWTPLPYTMVTPEAVSVLENQQADEAKEKVLTIQRRKELSGIPSSIMVAGGDPATELDHFISEYNIDLVVLSTHGRTGFKHLVMGSVAEELFRSLRCPVLTLGPHIAERFATTGTIKHILFPSDLSRESKAVFPYVASLASEYSSGITFLHVLPRETGSNPEAAHLAEPLRRKLEDTFATHISPRCQAAFLIDFGDPAERILARAKELNADLIAFGARKGFQITTHLRNTVAYKVVVGAECPVLTCRGE